VAKCFLAALEMTSGLGLSGCRQSPSDWLKGWKTEESPDAEFRQFSGRKTSIHDERR
jgi:hypothetical protein